MFRNRRSSQKPTDDLYKEFKASFSNFKQDSVQPGQGNAVSEDDSLTDTHTLGQQSQHQHALHLLKDAEPTPRGHMDGWTLGASGLTPSVLDPNSHSFNSFANQLPGYYTPTPGGSTLYHSHHAGDLHTPGLLFGLGTPLSMPTSEATMHAGQQALAMHTMPQNLQSMPQQAQFQGMDPYQMHQQPSSFQQRNNIQLQHMDSMSSGSPLMNDVTMDMGMQQSPDFGFQQQGFRSNTRGTGHPVHPLTERFRYHVTLNAPTAMVKHEDEIPITYLNKGQTYTLNVSDTAPLHSMVGQLKYRTFVRISFEDPDQRKRPAACWQLWKEGRGTNEAHLRGGRLQAVEYVESSGNTSSVDRSHPIMELECSSFDGFCVIWTPGANGQIECPIQLRFNFLSTDFSHSKGVKGIPVRLCTKTELLLDSMSPRQTQSPPYEIAFCKVKLFRDHGAERKLSNDIAHVKKTIEKVNQQIIQMETGVGENGKRKRSALAQDSQRPAKVSKHRRTWSTGSLTQSPTGKTSAEDELHSKLAALQEMFSSTRTSSVLFLRGPPEDDPDLYPVKLGGPVPAELIKMDSGDSAGWDKHSLHSSTMVSPTPSSHSIVSPSRKDSTFPMMTTRVPSNEHKQMANMSNMTDFAMPSQKSVSPHQQAIKVQTLASPTTNELSSWIDAFDVDQSYNAPAPRVIKPVACFYVQTHLAHQDNQGEFYRAIYLMQRTLKDFNTALCLKANLEPSRVHRIIRVNQKGLPILLDDSDIVEIPEGQDMKAIVQPIGDQQSSPMKANRNWDLGTTDIQVDSEIPVAYNQTDSAYELRLFY